MPTNKIILFSDLHYGINIKNRFGKKINTHGNTDKLLERFVNKVKEIEPIMFIHLGDLVMVDKSNKNFREEKGKIISDKLNYLSNIGIPFFNVVGNHDVVDVIPSINDIIGKETYYSLFKGDYLHIFLDIKKDEKLGTFFVPQKTLDFLKQELSQSTYNTIVYCHFPINQQKEGLSYYHTERPQKAFLSNSKEIKEILKNSKCKMFISGHSHFFYETIIDGITHLTVPSFSEDDNGRPSGKYILLNLNNLNIEIASIT